MESVLVLVLVLVLVVAGLVTGTVLTTRRVVRRLRGSTTVRRAGELGGYATLAVGVARHPARADSTAALLAARVTTASVQLRREVLLAQRCGTHLGDVPAVLPQLTDEAFALSRGLRQLTTGSAAHAADLCAAAREHLTVVADVRAAVGAAAALPSATGGATAEAARAAGDLRAWTTAYRDLVRPVTPG